MLTTTLAVANLGDVTGLPPFYVPVVMRGFHTLSPCSGEDVA